MRVLQVIGSIARETGGPARSSQGLCAGLERCGCEAWLLSHTPGETAWLPGVRHFMTTERGGYGASVEAMERAITASQPSVIQCNGLWSPYTHAAVLCAKRHRVPLVIAPRGTLAPWALNYKKWKKRLAWWLYQKRDLQAADAFHVTSEEEASQVRAQGLKQPIILLPNGVDLPPLHAAEPQSGKPVRTVLYLGRIHFQKGLRELIQAWAEVKRSSLVHECEGAFVQKGEAGGQQPEDSRSALGARMNARTNELPRWQLELVGPDVAGHQSQLIAEAERLGLKVAVGSQPSAIGRAADAVNQPSLPDVIFTGPLDDDEKWGAYARADVVVLPSYTENFGLTVAEGLAAGKPVITTKGTPWQELLGGSASALDQAPGAPGNAELNEAAKTNELMNSRTDELVASGRCGWWIEIGTGPLVTALKEAALLNDGQRIAMGTNGRRLVEEKYGWTAISTAMMGAYAWLLRRGQLPACIRIKT